MFKHLLVSTCSVFLLFASSSFARSGAPVTVSSAEFPKDACQFVPGSEAASALGGTLSETKTIQMPDSPATRCVYFMGFPGPKEPETRAYILWLLLEEDYAGMKAVHEGPVQEVTEMGDAAFQVFDSETGRFDLLVLKRGALTVEVTGPDEASVRKLAQLALSKLN